MIIISVSADDKLITVVGKVAVLVVSATMWSIRKFRQNIIKMAQGE
jgi:hypothetical protein